MSAGPNGTGRRALVIGGGVIGAACAHYLCRSGWNVVVIDRRGLASGSSHANCGFICPSHILPLAEPGMIGEALRGLKRKGSPFLVRPRFDPALWAWMLRFARRCNKRDMIAAGRGIQGLLASSRVLYDEIIEREGLDCEFQSRGLLLAYRDRHALESYAATDRILTKVFEHPARRLDGAELAEFEPALRPGLAGGWYYREDAHLRPDKLMSEWLRALEAGGVEARADCPFLGFAAGAENGRAAVARTGQGDVEADLFVVATGAWTPKLSEQLGCRVPIQPGKGYSITMPRPEICPRVPMIFPETRVAVTPFVSGYRLGSTMEFAGYDESLRPERLQLLRDGAAPYLREPYRGPIEEQWFGWRPMTTDSLPIIDFSPRWRNVIVAAGHNMLGLSMAPATGKLVAELADGSPPHLDPAPYRANRF